MSINIDESGLPMQSKQLFKPLTRILAVGLTALALSTAAMAAPTTFNESASGTGNLPGATDVVAGGAESGLNILGNLIDGRGGHDPNLVDMFKFGVGYAGRYFFDTFGSVIPDTQLFLFDSLGNGLYWNNDASVTPVDTLSAFSIDLGVGDYYIAVSFYGLDPDDGAGSIFDTLSNGGGAWAGSGSVSRWNDFNGATLWDTTGYVINAHVPEPNVLALSLVALGLLAGFSRRRQDRTG